MLQMKLPSSQQHNFANVPNADIPRSKFDRSFEYKTTFDIGYLIPFLVDEVLPGDTFSVDATLFARILSPLQRPVMHNMYLDVHYFFVPNRLVWNNWQKFNGEQTDPGDSTDYLVPTMTAPVGGYASQSLHDYFGLPTGIAGYTHISLYHRAYNLIWNEWYRDQNLQDSVVVDKDDGPDTVTDYVLLRRGKRHDYFTSALPFPQKGPAVQLPLSGNAPVIGSGTQIRLNTTGSGSGSAAVYGNASNANAWFLGIPSGPSAGTPAYLATSNSGMVADLTDVAAATINQLRESFQIQKLYERDARGGTRYTEIIRAHFGVTSPDARLQRPEYLGGGSTPITVTPIAQNSSTDATTPQGNLAAVGTVAARNNGFTKSFTEHGMIIGLASARADLIYQEGLPRPFSRQIRWDYYWPALCSIGEQPVYNKEIYTQGTSVDDDVFGYQERYAEYRYKPSLVTGLLRSQAAGSLDIWHLGQDFSSLPSLNSDFIQENPPMDRVIAVPSEPHFIMDSYIRMTTARPMPMFGVPGLIDHF